MPQEKISIKGAREHNLKNISLSLPRHKLIVITGLSGSGKSSLAFDTIYREGQRRYAESFSAYARQFLGVADRPDVDQIEGLSPTISIDQRTLTNNPRSTVGTMSEIYDYLRILFANVGVPYCPHCGEKIKKKKILLQNEGASRRAKQKYLEVLYCPKCQKQFPKLEPRLFSFNAPTGACPYCKGLGTVWTVNLELIAPNKKLSFAEGGIQPWTKFLAHQNSYRQQLEEAAKKYKFSLTKPLAKLKEKDWEIILYGDPERRQLGRGKEKLFAGIVELLQEKYEKTNSAFLRKEIGKYLQESLCPFCHGERLRPEALQVKIGSFSISQLSALPLEKLGEFFQKEKKLFSSAVAQPLVKEITKRIDSLLGVGLGYLTLDRSVITLSGGEAQRIRIANQINALLSNIIYVLDEPSIGLHPSDLDKLIATLKKIRDFQNTVIVVEHDQKIMEAADYLVDMGPGAGDLGGEVVFQGTYSQILKANTLTAKYLRGEKKVTTLKKEKTALPKDYLVLKGAQEHNLKNITVKFPLGKFIAVTGVSGSGKSTLVLDILGKALARKLNHANVQPGKFSSLEGLEKIKKVIQVDQSPIGRSPRSNPATYTGIFSFIRNIFALTPEARRLGYDPGFFSFNVDGGRCPYCSGEGYVKVEMHLLNDVYVECEACQGRRYNEEALQIYYKGKNIADILAMSVDEAFSFFRQEKALADKLKVLQEVGLGYLPLGQPATALSGGEAQRIKLATELSRRSQGETFYILDEPTTGLHFEDIRKLLDVLEALVKKGNTVVVIEHNLDVIARSDWVIDLGPRGGEQGGEVVFSGPLTDFLSCPQSLTARYLQKH